MRERTLFVCIVAMLLLAIVVPANAKPPITAASISGPGLEGGVLHIWGRGAAGGMWASGIDLFGELDEQMGGSVAELGLTVAELGPGYDVRYTFDAGRGDPPEVVRQRLYPYAKGGPVTYTPPGRRMFGGLTLTTGWYQSSSGFFRYLVDRGLPAKNPVVDADLESASGAGPTGPIPWVWIALALGGLVVSSMAAPPLRRRVLAVTRTHG